MSDSDTSPGDADPTREAYPGDSSPFQPAPARPLLQRAVPLLRQLRGYRAGTARRDVLGGVTVAALAVPAAMAYAELAGLSPVNGLYALLLPTLAYVLLGSSRQLVVGPEGSISALVAVSVLSFAAAGSTDAAELAAMLALLVGACYLLCQGSAVGGWSLYVLGNRLHYAHNYVRRAIHRVSSPEPVPEGRHELRFEFEPTGPPDVPNSKGAPGRAQLYIDGTLVAQTDMPVTTPVVLNPGGLTCGANPGSPVSPTTRPPSASPASSTP